ncbi:hypothetical protein BH09BAC2_BH09BAC2_13710 [soil metagenome]
MLYSIGFYFIYTHQIKEVKKKNHHTNCFDLKPVTTISIPLHNGNPVAYGFEWIEEYEISYNGILYDIVYVKYENDKAIFSCVADKKETKLQNALNDQSEKQADNNASKKSDGAKTLLLFSPETLFTSQNFYSASIKNYILFSEITVSTYRNIPSPPPWA